MKQIIIIALMLVISLVAAQTPPTQYQSITISGNDYTYRLYNLNTGKVMVEQKMPVPTDQKIYSIIGQTNNILTLVVNYFGQGIGTATYNIKTNVLTQTGYTNNAIGFGFNYQQFGYNTVNNTAYLGGFDSSVELLATFTFDFQSHVTTAITTQNYFNYNFAAEGAYDSVNNVYYMLYESNFNNSVLMINNFAQNFVNNLEVDLPVGNNTAMHVYNQQLFVGNVVNGVNQLHLINVDTLDSKVVFEQTAGEFQYYPIYVFDPNGFVVIFSPDWQYDDVQVTVVSLNTFKSVGTYNYKNTIPVLSYIMSTFNI